MKTAVLFVAHFLDDKILERYKRLEKEVGSDYDLWLMLNRKEDDTTIPSDIKCYYSTKKDIDTLGYRYFDGDWLYRGSCNFPIQKFRRDHKEYDFYWFIEYDVNFTGVWKDFLDYYKNNTKDFLSCHVEHYRSSNRFWCWWRMGNKLNLSTEVLIKGFNPICRYSGRALDYLDSQYIQGKSAHSEVFITSILFQGKYSLGKLDEHYIPDNRVNGGSVRYRPLIDEKEMVIPQKLYHPYK